MIKLLNWLENQGCYPSIYYRGGGIWRAHVNSAGNYWSDSRCALTALRDAIDLWEKAGRPTDGMADGAKYVGA